MVQTPNTVNNTRKFRYNRNIFPDSLERHIFNKMDPIVKNLRPQTNSICRNHISEGYIRKAFNNFTHGYYYRDSDNNIVGFCIWKEHKDLIMNTLSEFRHISVLLICAKPTDYKLGKIILFDMESYVLTRNYNMIRLQPANKDLIPYYESNGYVLKSSFEHIYMDKELKVLKIDKKNSHHSKTQKSRIPHK